ncbi:MAG: DUF2059 domain-containing protein [Candidatus Omnitrophica bacterium]|nr:DUF2059 domain-containing protein [Candidatus Omnitrophota bacterium]
MRRTAVSHRQFTKSALVICVLGLSLVKLASAEENPTIPDNKRTLVLELLQVTDAKNMASTISEAMLQQIERSYPQLVAQLLPDVRNTDQEVLRQRLVESRARFSKRFRELYLQRIDLGQTIQEVYVPLYAKYFSEQELKDLINFYRSPSGKKALSVMPNLLRESMQRSSQLLNPKIMDIVKEIIEEEKPRLIEAPAAAPSAAPAATPTEQRPTTSQ